MNTSVTITHKRFCYSFQNALSTLSRFVLEHVADLGRQDERAAVVPTVEVGDDLGRLCGLIFVHEVAGFGKDSELVFACDDGCYSGEYGRGARN